ncbi:hypothetical protein HY634_02665 [Candidatus Uhrbacteria bacterium]|nr:hypothetical protein [Candidatus Uhrbacteria bacterium]
MTNEHDIVYVDPKPVEPQSPRRVLPPVVAKTVNLCVNCVTGAGRMVRDPLRRRHERHYHSRHRFGRHHLAADVAFVVAILALIGTNMYLLGVRPSMVLSNVKLEWTAAPAIVRSGDAVMFTLTLRHDGDEPLEDATVALRLPERLVVTSVAPTSYDAVTHTVRIGTVAPGATSRIDVRGITDAPDGTTLHIEGTFHGRGATRSERMVATGTVEVRGTAVTFAIGPQGDGPAVVRLGQPMEIGVSYTSTLDGESAEIEAPAFRVTIAGPLAAASTAAGIGAVVRRGEIRWPVQRASAGGEIVRKTFLLTPPSEAERIVVPAGVPASYTLIPELILIEDARGVPVASVVGAPFMLPVAGELRLTSVARYFTPEGDQVGRGPLPPRVGQTTKYWVTWEAQSFLRDADRVTVRAKLLDGVEWTGRAMTTVGEDPTFDTTSRTVTWVMGRLERTTGSQRVASSASFELAFTPTTEQVDAFATVLGETIAEGVDDLGAVLKVIAPVVTTELVGDERAKGSGRVR